VFLKDGPPKGDAPARAPNPLSDPAAMDGMMAGMKTQMVRAARRARASCRACANPAAPQVMMVPQMLIMSWINFFFQGFVLSASAARARAGTH
jgi:hypothetical protein